MPNDLKKLRRLMRTANDLKKTRPAILRGAQLDNRNALKYAWWFENFRAKLSTGVYRFSYFKLDGSIREARGTLDMSRIPEDQHPTGQSTVHCPLSIFNYYDLDAGGWRSFHLDLFIGFVERLSADQQTSRPVDQQTS